MNRNLNILITVFLVAITACADSALEEWKPYLPSEGKFLTLSSESLSFVADGGSEVITVTTDGTFTVSTNESWLLVTSERNTITITALTNTTTNSRTGIVFVSLSNNTSSSLSKTVSVQQNARSNLINGHEYVDLGLPSGTLWASWNVGATAPEEYGDYYAWGETEEKDYYDWSNYVYCDGSKETCQDIGGDISRTEYDVAHVKWGSDWQMPTYDQFSELLSSCNFEETSLNGIKGAKIVGPNGNCIFMPATDNYAFDGSYWSATNNYTRNSYFMALWGLTGNFNPHMVSYPRYEGCCIRPVAVQQKQYPVAEAIDLGLPSGTKWASWNVGASKPEEYGGYYAWGETEEKDYYDWSTYKWCNGSDDTITKYCANSSYGYNGFTDGLTELLPEDDAATVNWGTPWRMPTFDQIKELLDNCTQTWTQQNGVNGILVTGPNGRTIFLPAAGCRWGGSLYIEGSDGYYWRSSTGANYSFSADVLYFDSGDWYWNNGYARDHGQSVRAVCP